MCASSSFQVIRKILPGNIITRYVLASTILSAALLPAFAYGGDYTNTLDNASIPNGTVISGNLYQDGGTLSIDGVRIDKTLYANSGTLTIGDIGGAMAESLTGPGNLDLTTTRKTKTNTPSPDSTQPYPGELVLTNGQSQTFSGNISGRGDLTLVAGTQSLTGNNSLTGVTAIRNGTLILTGNGSITGPRDSATIDVGLSYSDHGQLIVDGPKALITNEMLSVGNGDPSYGAGGTQGTSVATFKNGATLDNTIPTSVGVGNLQHGILNVESGSKLIPYTLFVGGDPTSKGVVNLTDAGSTITANATYVGATGSGTLNITNNAVFQAIGTFSFGMVATPPSQNKSSGTVNITNNGVLQAKDTDNTPGISAIAGAKTAFNIDNGIIENVSGSNLTSSVSANLTDAATFNTQGNNTISWNAGLTGTGSLVKQDEGTLSLAVENSYTGGTFITQGTLSLVGAGSLDKSAGVYVGKASVFDLTGASNTAITSLGGDATGKVTLGSNSLTITDGNSGFGNVFNGTISGQGGVNITGGSEVFTGNNDYAGQTSISNSTLEIDGDQSAAKGDTKVFDNGILQGSGTLGGSTTISNGTIVAGLPNETKSLSINGTLNLDSTSTTSVYGNSTVTGHGLVNGAEKSILQSGMITVGGTASLGGTLSLNASSLVYGEAYRVLEAKSTSGKYNSLSTNQDYAFATPLIFYDAENGQDYVDISLVKNADPFSHSGSTHNEKQAAKGLNSLPSDSPVIDHIASTQKGQVSRVLNSLTGEIHSSVRTGLIEDSRLVENAVMNRMVNMDCDFGNGQSTYDLNTHKKHACDADHTILWGQAYGSLGHNSGDGDAAGMSHNTAGFIIGADTKLRNSQWRVGGFAAYGHSMFNIGARDSSARSDNITVGGYAARKWGHVHLRTGASYSWNIINTRRNVMEGLGRSHSSYNSGTAMAFAELGYKHRFGKHVLEPFANVTYVNFNTGGFREDGIAGLHSKAMDTSVTFTSFGMRYNTKFNIGKLVFAPHAMLAYRHATGNLTGKSNMRFNAGGDNMGIYGASISDNSAVVGTGVTAQLNDRVTVDLSYYGQFGNRSIDNGVTGSVKYRF